jgi:3-hydroxybutyryl-CoA dehydrogenase
MAGSKVKVVTVVGAGIMGRGIALASARAGFETRVIEPSARVIESARSELDKILARSREKGEIQPADADAATARLTWSEALDDAKGSDLVIEAVPESVALKAELYTKLAPILPREAIVATNTSGLEHHGARRDVRSRDALRGDALLQSGPSDASGRAGAWPRNGRTRRSQSPKPWRARWARKPSSCASRRAS